MRPVNILGAFLAYTAAQLRSPFLRTMVLHQWVMVSDIMRQHDGLTFKGGMSKEDKPTILP